MASSALIVSPEVLRNFRHRHIVTHWGRKVLFMVLHNSFLHGQTKTISEILDDKKLLTGKSFSYEERKNLAGKSPEDFDITLLYKICEQLWQQGVNNPGDELRKLVKLIKDERNPVNHDMPVRSSRDWENRLREFQATLEATLDKTKSCFRVRWDKIDQLKVEIQDAVSKLWSKIHEKYDPSNKKDMEEFKKEIAEFPSVLSELVKEYSQREFCSFYKSRCKTSPFDWLPQYCVEDSSNIIIPLRVEDDKRFNQNISIIVNQQEIFDTNKMGADYEVLIISGDAGSGKTTILCSFVENWYKKTSDIPQFSSFETLLFMQFKDQKYDNFDAYLKGLLPRTVAYYDFPLVKSHILGSKCLIFCDGYDEANVNSKKLFEEMLTLKLNAKKIVVTTRSWNTEELINVVDSRKCSKINLKVLGLQEEDFHLLKEKLIDCRVEDTIKRLKLKSKLSKKIKEMDNMTKECLKSPLLFKMFMLLYVDRPCLRNQLSTWETLYSLLKKNLDQRILNKTRISEEELEKCYELYLASSGKDMENLQIRSQAVKQHFNAIMSSYCILEQA
ncbi:uncharacterized protein LOC135198195 [Macrobrachium nipponense]|uniref:uncharacterized protein LOC135198195 n=1 Tax=Macrobrachium nipponense TaxID=159736 RepID=UPI0030C7DC24